MVTSAAGLFRLRIARGYLLGIVWKCRAIFLLLLSKRMANKEEGGLNIFSQWLSIELLILFHTPTFQLTLRHLADLVEYYWRWDTSMYTGLQIYNVKIRAFKYFLLYFGVVLFQKDNRLINMAFHSFLWSACIGVDSSFLWAGEYAAYFKLIWTFSLLRKKKRRISPIEKKKV